MMYVGWIWGEKVGGLGEEMMGNFWGYMGSRRTDGEQYWIFIGKVDGNPDWGTLLLE